MTLRPTALLATLAVLCMLPALCHGAREHPVSATTIPSGDQLRPAELADALRNTTAPRPLILQVGFRTLFEQAHIPGAEYVGAASDGDGLRALRERVTHLARDSAIVIYCGCCPWTHCPNMGAAYAALHALGFTRLRVLYLANNFGTDWVEQGYPVVRSP